MFATWAQNLHLRKVQSIKLYFTLLLQKENSLILVTLAETKHLTYIHIHCAIDYFAIKSIPNELFNFLEFLNFSDHTQHYQYTFINIVQMLIHQLPPLVTFVRSEMYA